MSAIATKLITAEEFMNMPEPADGSKQELLRGEIVTMAMNQDEHCLVQAHMVWLLKNVVYPGKLGWVLTENAVTIERDPDTVRGPDISFYSIHRVPNRPHGYNPLPPDLVVEILSPSDRRGAVRDKIREYIRAGVPLIWLVDPELQIATVYAGSIRGVEHDSADTITGGDVLPGFACKVAEFFAD